MRKMKWFSTVLLTLVFAMTAVLAGCGGSKNEVAPKETPKNVTTVKEKLKIDVISTGGTLPKPEDDFVKQGIEKALNIDLQYTTYASVDDYTNQLNVRMASGNFPDLFGLSKDQIKTFAQQGLILNLSDYLDKLKPTVDFIGKDSLTKGTFNGKVYATAKAPNAPQFTLWVRKDWMDNLKMSEPKTLDELKALAVAFTQKDPDGNGKNDTYGFTGSKLSAFQSIFGGFGVGFANDGEFYVKDGKIVNSFYDPKMKDALTFVKDMVASGVVDPEIMANGGDQHVQKAIQGKAGIIYTHWPSLMKAEPLAQMKTVNPNAKWVQISPPKGPVAAFDGAFDIGAGSGFYAIPKALEKQPEKLQRVFDLLNYVSSQGSNLVQFGVEGKHYNMVGGKAVATELMAKESGYTYNYQFTGRPDMSYLQVKFATESSYIAFAASLKRIEVLDGFITNPDGYNSADTSRYIEEELSKFIYGKRPLDQYDAFLKTLEGNFNYKMYVDSVTNQLKALGFAK